VRVILVTALLILPGAIGTLAGGSMRTIVASSLLAAVSSAAIGMVISNSADVAPGASIVLTIFGFFLIVFLLRRRRDIQSARKPRGKDREHKASPIP
jgi:zinc transport system permease protein